MSPILERYREALIADGNVLDVDREITRLQDKLHDIERYVRSRIGLPRSDKEVRAVLGDLVQQ